MVGRGVDGADRAEPSPTPPAPTPTSTSQSSVRVRDSRVLEPWGVILLCGSHPVRADPERGHRDPLVTLGVLPKRGILRLGLFVRPGDFPGRLGVWTPRH